MVPASPGGGSFDAARLPARSWPQSAEALLDMDPSFKPAAFVLEDHHVTAEIVCRMFAACGFAPSEFSDAGACLQRLNAAVAVRPDVIALDLALGQSDAIEVIRQLERMRYKGKVLLFSGCDEATLRDVEEVGVLHGLSMLPSLKKPFRIDELKSSLGTPPLLRNKPPQEPTSQPLKIDLFNALTSGWLELWYQPKFDIKTFAMRSAEALLRMRHPKLGILSPAHFLPPAGEPIYFPLSKFVVKLALADWSSHFADLRPPPMLAVNVPLSVMMAPGFVDFVRGLLPRGGKFPGLIIEATESDVIRNSELAREVGTQLKLYNILLSIDDFGAAYSTFSRLRDLPAIEVKIDGSFVKNCASDAAKRALCLSVIELAHRFGASACAEGVEDQADLQTLTELGCDTVQGYFLAKPQPPQGLRSMLARADAG
jgi:EAL domain-containing protein (putative c-di-GMP-specific phosphodiesterase class I)/ActR/RegA family two-component response regulator